MIVVWQRFDGLNRIVQAAGHPFGKSFSAPVDLSLPGEDAISPQVAIDQHGNVVAVWERFNGTNEIVQASVRALGTDFSAPVDLSPLGEDAMVPQVKLDNHGKAVVVWEGTGEVTTVIEASIGIDLFTPLPPQYFRGFLKSARFIKQKDYINQLQWQASFSSDVAHYNLYVNGVFAGPISSQGPFVLDVHNRKKNMTYIYALTAVSLGGFESQAATVVLKGGK